MLVELQAAVVRRRRGRKGARIAVAAVILLAGVLAAWSRFSGPEPEEPRFAGPPAPAPSAPAPPGRDTPPASTPVDPPLARLHLEIIHNVPGIVSRHAASDEDLIAFMAEAGRPAGVIRVGGRVLVTEN